ncbi:DUF1499 domain-containing protein [Tropicimonas isoalkanivorans]|uniref:DUF1499 domain-containing protein n=1 Tax=Tropicimonas isoalkanivorans TaxID=441112 RepID=A0A1I1DVG6_9RHOB|nr:DUF1499 domain-containing protein [Tropicimonas isoalkanivorans]SFB78945.1 Protein of unknown function [Tropicimonas isoalkanivorans]
MRYFLILAILAVAAFALLYFRLAPSDPARWHVDPRTGRPGDGRFTVLPEGGDIEGPVFGADPQAVLGQFDSIAVGSTRTSRLAGSVADGRVTYVSRSLLFGFPDYTTVEAVPEGQGTRLLIFARARYGKGDMGVNRRRVSGWLEALAETVPVIGEGAET